MPIIIILALESSSRFAAAMMHVERPISILFTLTGFLIPEYLGVALPLASYLGTALVIRHFAITGEWQIFQAVGVPPHRLMLMPLVFACLAAGMQLCTRLEFEPRGERAGDALRSELKMGLYGLPFDANEIHVVDPDTAFLANRSPRSAGLSHIFLRTGQLVMAAPTGSFTHGGDGHIRLSMANGTIVRYATGGGKQVVHFSTLTISPPGLESAPPRDDVIYRMDRVATTELVALVDRERRSGAVIKTAAAALVARFTSALSCLLFPWVALICAVPPPRKSGGGAIFLGIIGFVMFIKTSDWAQSSGLTAPYVYGIGHFSCWSVLVAVLTRWSRSWDIGAADLALGAVTRNVLHSGRTN